MYLCPLMVKTNWHGLGISVFACLSENQRLFGRRTELGSCQRIVKGFAELPKRCAQTT